MFRYMRILSSVGIITDRRRIVEDERKMRQQLGNRRLCGIGKAFLLFAFGAVLIGMAQTAALALPPITRSEDSFAGSGCASCAGGDTWAFPAPSMRQPLVYGATGVPESDLGPAGGFLYYPLDSWASRMFVVDRRSPCSRTIWVHDLCGQTYESADSLVFGVPQPLVLQGSSNGARDGWSVTMQPQDPNDPDPLDAVIFFVSDSSGASSTWYCDPVSGDCDIGVVYALPASTKDAAGNETTFVRDGDTVAATTSAGEEWAYTLDGNEQVTQIVAPNLDEVDVTYAAPGKLQQVVAHTSSGAVKSDVTYGYDTEGRIASAVRGTKQVNYAYDYQTITVTETPENEPNTVLTRTVYEYDPGTPLTTTVTRKSDIGTQCDQKTAYTFASDGAGGKWKLIQVEDPMGNVAQSAWDEYTGRLNYQIDPSSLETHYEYNDVGAVTTITQKRGTETLSTEEFVYCKDAAGNDTQWLKSQKDVRGKWAHYTRNTSTLWRLDAVKVSEPEGTPPAEPEEWSAISPVKQYEYYSSTEDISGQATLTWDHDDPPYFSPANLRDGRILEPDAGDHGIWDYSGYVEWLYDANASYWDWTSAKTIKSIDLYLVADDEENQYYYQPQGLSIYAKDGQGDYTIPILVEGVLSYYDWPHEYWNDMWVVARHVSVDVSTTGLRIIYGRGDSESRLSEIRIQASVAPGPGQPGQLKREIIPDVGGAGMPTITAYEYDETVGSEVRHRSQPTVIWYQSTASTGEPDVYTRNSYDDSGRLMSTTDAEDRTVQYELTYDATGEGRTEKTIYATGVETESHYTCCGIEWSDDEENNRTHYLYDALNQLWKVYTSISGQSESAPLVQYEYDEFGNKKTVTTRSDASTTRVTTYTYDKNNRVVKVEYPGGLVGSEEFGYCSSGQLLWKKDGNGSYTYYKYDDLNRMTDIYYNAGPPSVPFQYPQGTSDVHYDYDGSSSLRTTARSGDLTSTYSYDIQGRVAQYTPPAGLASGYYVDYGYNGAGQESRVKITNGTTVNYDAEYEYYRNGWLKKVKDGAQDLATYSYNDVGVRTRVDYGNGVYTTYDYSTDPRYLISQISHMPQSGPALMTIAYPQRDKVGNPESMQDSVFGNWGYTYDANNRLDTATPPAGPVPDQPIGGDYEYDWVGNRLNPPSGTNHMVHNAVDELTTWPGMYTYTYWQDGSLKEVRNPAGTQVLRSYTYSYAGLLDQAAYSGRTATNTWDADSDRVGLVMNGTTYSFVYDTAAGIPAVIVEGDGIAPVYYFREPNGALVARSKAGDGRRYYHFDALGSTRMLTRDSGNVTDKYSYDAWGGAISHDRFAGSVDQPYQYVGQLGYYTHYQDPGLGLLELGVRFYDPEIGRFTQRDAIPVEALGVARYPYVAAPTALVDPSGKWIVGVVIRCLVDARCRRVALCVAGLLANSVWELITELVEGRCCDWAKIGCVGLCGCVAAVVGDVATPGDPFTRLFGGLLFLVGSHDACRAACDRWLHPCTPAGVVDYAAH